MLGFDFIEAFEVKKIIVAAFALFVVAFFVGMGFYAFFYPQEHLDFKAVKEQLDNIDSQYYFVRSDMNTIFENQRIIYSLSAFSNCVQAIDVNGKTEFLPLPMSVSTSAEISSEDGTKKKFKVFNGIVCPQGGGESE